MFASTFNGLMGYVDLEVVLKDNSQVNLQGKNVLVTGGTGGIGAGSTFCLPTWDLSKIFLVARHLLILLSCCCICETRGKCVHSWSQS